MDTPVVTIHIEEVNIPNSGIRYVMRWSEWEYADECVDVYENDTYFWKWRPGDKWYIPYEIEKNRFSPYIEFVKDEVEEHIYEMRKDYLYISF